MSLMKGQRPKYANAIRNQRVTMGLSLRETARKAGIETVRLGEIERGIEDPTFGERTRLSQVFLAALGSDADQ